MAKKMMSPQTPTIKEQKLSTDALKAKLNSWIDKSRSFIENHYSAKWDLCDKLYQGILSVDDGVPEWRSKLFIGLTFGIANQDVRGSIKSLYAPNDFVHISPANGGETDKDIVSALAMEKVMIAQEKQMGLYRELYDCTMDCIVKSVGIVKVDWLFENVEKSYLDMDNGKIIEVKDVKKLSTPRIVSIAPEDFIIDEDCKDLKTAKYAGHRYTEYVSNMKDNVYYNRQDEVSDCLSCLEGEEVIDVYEIWEANHVYAITQTGHIVKDHVTPYKHNMIPYAVCVKYPRQRSIYGLSTVEMFADIQDWTNTLVNETIDNMRLSLQKMFLMSSASDLTPGQLRARPGLILKVRDMGEIKEFPVSPVNQDVYKNIQQMEQFTNRILGNLDNVDSTSVGTATEAKLIFQRAQGVYEVFANYNRDNFFKRIVKMWIELNQQFIKPDDIKGILTKKELKSFNIETSKVDFGAEFEFSVTGDKGLEDKTMLIDKINSFTDAMAKAAQLPPEIDRVKYVKRLIMLYGIGDDILAQNEEQTPNDDKIMGQINEMAQSQGITAEQFIMQLAEQKGVDPTQIIDEARAAGDFKKYIAGADAAMKEAGAELDAETEGKI